MKLRIETSNATFKQLHDLNEKRGLRKQISKAALTGLLLDHSRMIRRLEDHNTELEIR